MLDGAAHLPLQGVIPADGFYEWQKSGATKIPAAHPHARRGPLRLRRPLGDLARSCHARASNRSAPAPSSPVRRTNSSRPSTTACPSSCRARNTPPGSRPRHRATNAPPCSSRSRPTDARLPYFPARELAAQRRPRDHRSRRLNSPAAIACTTSAQSKLQRKRKYGPSDRREVEVESLRVQRCPEQLHRNP